MKSILVLLLSLLLFAPRTEAQTTGYVDLYVAYDTDAESYIQTAGIVDPVSIARINAFVIGMKQLNLWTNCVELITLRTNQNAGAGTTAYALKGNNVTLTGSPTWSEDGLSFPGTAGVYGTFNNPFQSTAVNSFTIAVGYSAAHSASATCIIGSYNTGNLGPALWINSDPAQGNITNSISQYWSTNGTSAEGWNGYAGRYIRKSSQNGTNQFVIAAREAGTGFKMSAGIDGPYTTSTNALSPVWNNNSTWRIGATLVPGSYLNGIVSFVGIWTRYLTDSEMNSVRRLFTRTIGAGWMPTVNLFLEGDSLTQGDVIGTEVEWGRQLHTLAPWQGLYSKKFMATSGAKASTMANEVITNLYAYAREGTDFAQAQLYSVWGGANDIGQADPAETVFTAITNCWYRARSAGFKVIAWTIAPSGGIQGATEAERIKLNTLIRANRGRYDYLVDVARIPALQDTNSTYFHSDHIHFTTSGHTKIAEEFINSVPFNWTKR